MHLFFPLYDQLEEYVDESARPVIPSLFVITRWQSKASMLKSLCANKNIIRVMCASDDEECKALHDKDLTDLEWKTVEVSTIPTCFFLFLLLFTDLPSFARRRCLFLVLWLQFRNLWKEINTLLHLLTGVHFVT